MLLMVLQMVLKYGFKNTFNIKWRVFYSELSDAVVKYLILLDVNIIHFLQLK